MEHERRFVLSNPLDPAAATSTVDIVQVYMADGSRLRRSTDRATRAVEYNRIVKRHISGSSSTETGFGEATAEAFDAAVAAGRPRVVKVRRTYPHDGLVWEVDEFPRPLHLVIAEVETDDPDAAFAMHPEVARRVVVEVTGVQSASNAALAASWDPPEAVAIRQHLSKPAPFRGPCGCCGPQGDDPVCPCEMRSVERVGDRWYRVSEHRSPTGVTHSAAILSDVRGTDGAIA